MVFVHGLGDDWRTWQSLADVWDHDGPGPGAGPAWCAVGTSPVFLALDLPWRAGGDSEWRRLGSAGQWVARGLPDLGGTGIVLIGHSFGANAVLELLATGPPVPVRAAVLLAPTWRRQDTALTWALFDGIRATFERQIGDGIRARLGAPLTARRQQQIEALVADAVNKVGPAPVVAAFEQFSASAYLPLERITTPILVVAGGRDGGFGRSDGVALTDQLSSAQLCFDEEHDHFPHLHRTQQVADQIRNYLDRMVGLVPGQVREPSA